MAGFAILLGVGGALVIHRAVESTNDRILGAASRAIAESLTVEDGAIALDLSPAIFGMLEDAERDNVYYSIRENGRTVTGYADLPPLRPTGMADTEVAFGYALFRGTPVRAVSEGRRLPGIAKPVVVEVAETLSARQRIERDLLIGLGVLEAMLIGLGIVLLPVAIRWGMRPLTEVRHEMDRRLEVDLTPLPIESVPNELRELIVAFNGMLRRLEGSLRRTRQFAADASHQLRTPLSILRTHIGVLRAQSLGTEASASIEDIDEASARLQRLVVQLLALARADSTELDEAALTRTSLNVLVADVAADHAPAAFARTIELQFDPDADAPPILTQPLLATEMIGNFIDNAIRYGRDGGIVRIATRHATDRLEVIVEDDGPGIPEADRALVMTRFSRLNRDAATTGSGLGLSIAGTIARAIGARFTLETATTGCGLLVRISFPIA